MTQKSLRGLLMALGSLAILACNETRSDRPYTPFGVASVAEEPRPIPSAAAPSGAFAVEKAVLAPLGAKEWGLNGRTLKAPSPLVFEQALQADFTEDGQADVIAWLTSDPGRPKTTAPTSPGQLWLYDANAKPQKLLDAPGFLPTSASCKPSADLTRTGPSTITLRIATACDPPLLGRMPTQSISVVAPGREQPHVMTLRIAESGGNSRANTEKIEFEISSLDRDHDGRDDIELKAKIAGSQNNDTEMQFVWLDRKAGLSRDTQLPAKTFRDIGAIEVIRATGKNTSLRTLARIQAIRRMFGTLCAEGKVPTLFDQDNNPLNCNLSPETLGLFATAEVRAHLAQRAPGEALGALQRANWYGGAIPDKTKSDLTVELEKALPVKTARSVVVSNAPASSPSSIPRFSPLAFSPEGLLIQNAEGVTRLDLKTFEEVDVSDEIDPWPVTVISPQGQRLMGVAYPCDRPTVTLLAAQDTGVSAEPIATPLLAPRPGTCSGSNKRFGELILRPIAWSKAGLRVLLGASEVGTSSNEALPLGSARSANGEHAVTTTDLGILVMHKTSAELWRSPDAPTKRLSECVIDNRAEHVACLEKGHAHVFTISPSP